MSNFKKNEVMKKLNFDQMENLQGGWTIGQHIGCGLLGAVASGFCGGWIGPAAYIGCLLTIAEY